MDDRACEMRLVPRPGPGPDTARGADARRFSDEELDAARELAEYHRLMAAELAPHSRMRGLVLRCAGHWSRLGEIPRNGLAEAGRDELR